MSRDGDILDHVLGDAGDPERARMADLARRDPELAAELEELGAIAEALRAAPAEAWDERRVPPLPALPVAAAGDDPGDEAPAGGVVVPLRRHVSMPRFAAVAASLALLAGGVGIGALVFGGDGASPDPSGPAITLQSFGEGGPGAEGVARPISAGGGDLVLDVSGLAPSAGDEFYTAWLIDDDGGLQALGSFRVPEGGAASVTLPLPVDLEDFSVVDVSVESPDGDTGHSGRSVLRGTIGTA